MRKLLALVFLALIIGAEVAPIMMATQADAGGRGSGCERHRDRC